MKGLPEGGLFVLWENRMSITDGETKFGAVPVDRTWSSVISRQ